MPVGLLLRDALHLILPEPQLFWVLQNVIPHLLFTAIQTHELASFGGAARKLKRKPVVPGNIALSGALAHRCSTMWDKLKEQLPTVILTLVLIGGLAYWLHTRTVAAMVETQRSEIAKLQSMTDAEMQAAAAATRQQIEDLNQLLRDAIAQRSSDLFLNDQELAAANDARLDQIAGAIAAKIQPFDELPSSPEEAQRQERAQIDRVSDQLAQRIEPLLANLSSDTVRTRAALQEIAAEISDQMSLILTAELAKNQQLNDRLIESNAVARDSMILAQEAASLYVASFENSGMLTRILKLPANVIKDASKGSIVNSRDRAKMEEELAIKMAALQERLNEIDPEPAE
jgi:hypothetical protein